MPPSEATSSCPGAGSANSACAAVRTPIASLIERTSARPGGVTAATATAAVTGDPIVRELAFRTYMALPRMDALLAFASRHRVARFVSVKRANALHDGVQDQLQFSLQPNVRTFHEWTVRHG